MPTQLQKAINLAKKTGDRLIVYDLAKPDDTYVIMSLDEYEKIAIGRNEVRDLTEDELLDKINRDIAVWKNEQSARDEARVSGFAQKKNFDFDYPPFEDFEEDDYEDCEEEDEDEEDFDTSFYLKEEEVKKTKNAPRNHWAIPRERKSAADEIIEEDRQYLEEIN